MTVQEAVQLILQSSTRALRGGVAHGRILVLDMGKPIKIMDIARRMIRLAGLEPDIDVEIKMVGLSPGEKLYEERFYESDQPTREGRRVRKVSEGTIKTGGQP